DAGEQPHRGAAVPAIEGALGRGETAEPLAGDARRVPVELDVDAHRAERVGGRQVVEAAGEPTDAALALGERGEDEGAVPDGLVAGDAAFAAERARRPHTESLHGLGHSKGRGGKPRPAIRALSPAST